MNKTYRKIHLDYHTHGKIANLAGKFDADRFAGTLADAGVDCVALFAKGHYGYAFFKSQTNPVHPTLQCEFLPLAVEACRKRGIATESYISVCLDYQTYLKHPDWCCRNADGSIARWGEITVLLDLASPLLDEVVIPYTQEVVRRIPSDGLWFDIVMYPTDGFYSSFVTAELNRRGLEDTPESRGRLARQITIDAQRRLSEAARAVRPEVSVLVNNQALLGDTSAFAYSDVIEIESDPSFWPQHDLSLRCLYISRMGKDHHGLTTRFHRCWGDFGGLRSPAQLEFEIGNIMAAGSAYISLGDHLHPCGELQPNVYKLIGGAYERCKVVAPLVEGAKPLVEAALLIEPCPDPFNSSRQESAKSQLGLTRVLLEEHIQFAVIDAGEPVPAGAVMVLPGGKPLGPDVVAKVRQQVADGQPLLAFAQHVLGFEDLVGSGPAELSAMFGQHMTFEGPLAHELVGDMPQAVYEKVYMFSAGAGAEVLSHAIDPLFDKTFAENYHGYGPVNHDAPRRPVVVARGNVILCGTPLGQLVHAEGAWALLFATAQLIRRLAPAAAVVTDAGPTVEVAVHRKGGDLVLHLVSSRMPRHGLPPVRMRSFEPIRGVNVRLRGVKAPTTVTRAGSADRLLWDMDKDGLRLKLDLNRPHEVIILAGAGA